MVANFSEIQSQINIFMYMDHRLNYPNIHTEIAMINNLSSNDIVNAYIVVLKAGFSQWNWVPIYVCTNSSQIMLLLFALLLGRSHQSSIEAEDSNWWIVWWRATQHSNM